jgi:hypothetical protein
MEEKTFSKLLNKKTYQVFFFYSSVPIPLSFAVHSWIVINNLGKIERWESGQFYNPKPKKSWGNVYLGLFKNNPITGMSIFPYKSIIRFNSKLGGIIQGKTGSVAEKIIKFIEKKANKYPYKNLQYKLLGPNSNTFPQWILNQFPEAKIKLPWNAFGKNYKNN